MNTVQRAIALTAVVALAIATGLAAALGMLWLTTLTLPPFVEEVDDDTMREFGPVALAYATWALTTVGVLLFALRRYLRQT